MTKETPMKDKETREEIVFQESGTFDEGIILYDTKSQKLTIDISKLPSNKLPNKEEEEELIKCCDNGRFDEQHDCLKVSPSDKTWKSWIRDIDNYVDYHGEADKEDILPFIRRGLLESFIQDLLTSATIKAREQTVLDIIGLVERDWNKTLENIKNYGINLEEPSK